MTSLSARAPPPRAASPALSHAGESRPSTPNFALSHSTRTRPAATLNLAVLLADLDTLESSPHLLSSPEFALAADTADTVDTADAQLPASDAAFPQDLTRAHAAQLATEWLSEMDSVLAKVDTVLSEQPGHGQSARRANVDREIATIESGLDKA